MSAYEINQKAAEEICRTLRLNGQEFQLSECIALLDGKVVGIEKDLAAAVRALQAFDADSKRGMVFQVGPAIDIIRGQLERALK